MKKAGTWPCNAPSPVVAGLLIYRCLKGILVRERPFISAQLHHLCRASAGSIQLPLGPHAARRELHAAGMQAVPMLLLLLVPLTLLIAASRVVLDCTIPVMCWRVARWVAHWPSRPWP